MGESYLSCQSHDHSINIRRRSRWIFSIIFVPLIIFLIRPFIAKQILYRASAYEASNMYQESVRQYRKSLFIDPDNADGWSSLGDVYKLTGDMEKAKYAYKKALESEPQNRKALYNLGMIFGLNERQYEAAADCWNQVRELGPESTKERGRYDDFSYHNLSLRSLVTCYERLGEPDKAASVRKELHSYYPDED